MSAVVSITRREVLAYFVSPVAYAFITIFLLVTAVGFFFGIQAYMMLPPVVVDQGNMTLRTFLISGPFGLVTWANFAMIVSLPGLSMRLFTEERKTGTAELLFTSPLTTVQLVLGKYFGGLAVFGTILVLTLPLVGFLGYKARPEWGAVACAYLGLLLYGALLLSIGLFASTLTENQFVALIVTYALFLPFLVLDRVGPMLGGGLSEAAVGVSIGLALRKTALGTLDTHFVLLFLLLSSVFLFLSVRVLDSSRWR